jgi:glucosamine-6-phosphate isomerase
MKLLISADYDEMSFRAAELVMDCIKKNPAAAICFPSGESPAGMFKHLVEKAKAGNVDFRHCKFVGLDEWVGLGPDDDGSCTQFLNEHFFHPLGIKPPQVRFFNAKAPGLDAECGKMNDFIKENGPLDLMIVGIGMNGHIGLNEPGADFNLCARYAPLDPVTVSVGQKYFKKETVLTAGITLGLKHLQEAKTAVLLASGSKKAGIIAQSLQGEITNLVPASIFQKLPSAVVIVDRNAASELPV